jgi:hypothetical protein
MSLNERLSEIPWSPSRTIRRGCSAESLGAVTQRLGNAERELRVQFIRIGQLQAQLDLVMAALGRSSGGARVR